MERPGGERIEKRSLRTYRYAQHYLCTITQSRLEQATNDSMVVSFDINGRNPVADGILDSSHQSRLIVHVTSDNVNLQRAALLGKSTQSSHAIARIPIKNGYELRRCPQSFDLPMELSK